MNPFPSNYRARVAALVSAALLAACSSEKPAPKAGAMSAAAAPNKSMAGMSMAPVTIPKGVIYTEADVRFMQGMIAHHAQAIFMANMATLHGANPRVSKFANKIVQSQIAEIRLMQDWLRRNSQFAPDTSSWRRMQMPGMLTAQQLGMLQAAKGAEFDREFLTFMIQHHEGALKMVSDLFATPLAGQDVDVSVFANDVQAVQTAEIGVMQHLLQNLVTAPAPVPPSPHRGDPSS